MLHEPFHLFGPDQFDLKSVRENEVLFREGDDANTMFVSKDVTVKLVRVGPDGEPITIHKATPGQTFAEASVFAPHYHCDAVVEKSGTIYCIPKAHIINAFHNPAFAVSYNRIMSRQVQFYRQRVEIISINSASERVYAALVAGYLDGTIIQFSEMIALTHEATYRALRRLVNQGRILNSRRGEYRLPDSSYD